MKIAIISEYTNAPQAPGFAGGIERCAYLNAEALASPDTKVYLFAYEWSYPLKNPYAEYRQLPQYTVDRSFPALSAEAVLAVDPDLIIDHSQKFRSRSAMARLKRPLMVYDHNPCGGWNSVRMAREAHRFANWYTHPVPVLHTRWRQMLNRVGNEQLPGPRALPACYWLPEHRASTYESFDPEHILIVGRSARVPLWIVDRLKSKYRVTVCTPENEIAGCRNLSYDEIQALMPTACILLSSFAYESWGMAVFEASCKGLVSITSGTPSHSPILVHSPLSIVVPARKLVEAVEQFLSLPYDAMVEYRRQVATAPELLRYSLAYYQQAWRSEIERVMRYG